MDVNPTAHRTLLLLHGWPSLWASWKYQIQEFGVSDSSYSELGIFSTGWQRDYRLIVPNIRGFGASTHPGDVQSSGSFPDLVGDAVCILEHAGVSRAVAIGQVVSLRGSWLTTNVPRARHDWGTQFAYEAARERPDVFTAVVGITIPYSPAAGPFVPISALVPEFPRLAYQIYFAEQTSAAIAELNTDIRRTLRATLRNVKSPPPPDFLLSNSSFLAGWQNVSTVGLVMMYVITPSLVQKLALDPTNTVLQSGRGGLLG